MSQLYWQFSSALGEQRQRALSSAPPFISIVKRVHDEMQILCGHKDPCKDNAAFSRRVYTIQISRELFDLVFNSAWGLRASFYRSAYDGLKDTARLISEAAPLLLQAQTIEGDAEEARQSLSSPTAKVWLAECGNEPCRDCGGCKGEWTPSQDESAEIFNQRWESSTDPKARDGRKAPYFTKLRIYGAFLDSSHNEFTPERKRYRAMQLRDYGWS